MSFIDTSVETSPTCIIASELDDLRAAMTGECEGHLSTHDLRNIVAGGIENIAVEVERLELFMEELRSLSENGKTNQRFVSGYDH